MMRCSLTRPCDSNWIIADLNAGGAIICISQRPQFLMARVIDLEICKCRHLIESFFCKHRKFNRIAMPADRPALHSRP